jgi:hypothetical protein
VVNEIVRGNLSQDSGIIDTTSETHHFDSCFFNGTTKYIHNGYADLVTSLDAESRPRALERAYHLGRVLRPLQDFHHAAYGEADEYCCDGGYFEDGETPNLYGSDSSCQARSTQPSGCLQLTDGATTVGWWRADPNPDILNQSGVEEQGDDRRAAISAYANCELGRC